MRLSLADNPEAQNPGALTRAEYDANPDSAAGNNIRRGADKDVQQQQLSLGVRHFDAAGNEYAATVFGLLRDLENPLAAPPDIGGGPTNGTYVASTGRSAGVRLSGARPLGATERRRGSPPVSTFSGCGTTGRTSCPTPARRPASSSSTSGRR